MFNNIDNPEDKDQRTELDWVHLKTETASINNTIVVLTKAKTKVLQQQPSYY